MIRNCTNRMQTTTSLTRRVYETSGLIINPNRSMAWTPNANLIDGEVDNRTPGKVFGWMRFFRRYKSPLRVTFDLDGDFIDDIRGKVIRLHNESPSDENINLEKDGTYMEDFVDVQRGDAGEITAGIPLCPWTERLAQKLMEHNERFWDANGVRGAEREKRRQAWAERYRKHIEAGDSWYAYLDHPYIEWYSELNGRVVLELDSSQVEVVERSLSRRKIPRDHSGNGRMGKKRRPRLGRRLESSSPGKARQRGKRKVG